MAFALPDALKEHGIDFETREGFAAKELKNAAAYLELHIEQGPVLLDLDLPLGTVLGTFGVERHAITFHGQAAHSGSTPMNRRRDAFLAAAQDEPGNLSTSPSAAATASARSVRARPSPASSPAWWRNAASRSTSAISTPAALAQMLTEAKERERTLRQGRKRRRRLGTASGNIEPILFHDDLIAFATKPSAKPAASRIACRPGRCMTRRKSRAPACRRS